MNPSSYEYNPLANAESGQVMIWINPATGISEQIFNQYGIWGTCSFISGCPDPTADNYAVFADPDNCLPTIGVNGNVISCTDCLGNPPSSLYGDPLYPSAILPGTMGNQTCCEFTTVDDVVAGCTDPSATNYNENCQGVDVSAANNGQGALIDDGCCAYQQTWTVYCCDVGSWSGVPPLCCIDITVNTQVAYQSFIDSGDCYDDLSSCNGTDPAYQGWTFCGQWGPIATPTWPNAMGDGSCL